MSVNFPENPVGGTTLIIPAIQSANFNMTNGTGWEINADGSAYFFTVQLAGGSGSIKIDNNGNILGFNTHGNQVCSILPALDTIIVYADLGAIQGGIAFAISGKAGTDVFGNPYNEGLTLGYTGVPATNPASGQICVYADAAGNLKALTSAGNTRTIAAV